MPKTSARSASITSVESYSAMIIADLVAEVPVGPDDLPKYESRRRSSTPRAPKKPKVQTNHGFDESAELEASPSDREAAKSARSRSNASDISKGVLLNVVHFGQANDAQWVPFQKEDKSNDLKNKQLLVKMGEIPDGLKPAPVPAETERADMSLLRKVAFGFSFLPSVLFVLCFAVILPCEKPPLCVNEKWSTVLNGTGITFPLRNFQSILITFANESTNRVVNLDMNSGKELWDSSIDNRARFMICENFDHNKDGVDDCLVMDESHRLYVFNVSDGAVLWEINVGDQDNESASLPVILSNCTTNGTSKIAVAVLKTKLKIFSEVGLDSTFNISGCDTLPSKLTTWSRNDTTDLIFYCETGKGNGSLFKIPRDKWCSEENEDALETMTLMTSDVESLMQADLLPTPEGLVVWLKDYVALLQPDGAASWKLATQGVASGKRFLRYGEFNGKEKQIALFSRTGPLSFQVTTVSLSSGNVVWSHSLPNLDVVDVEIVPGENKYLSLVVANKIKTDLTTKAVAHINEVGTTIVSFLANDTINTTAYSRRRSLTQEISLLELDADGDSRIVQETSLPYSIDDISTTTIAHLNYEDDLMIIAANSYKLEGQDQETTSLRNVRVTNWDISSSKSSKCRW